MPATNRTTQQVPNKLVWEKTIDQYRLSGWPDRHPLPRRKQKRFPVAAFATLIAATDDGQKGETLCSQCPVVDASVAAIAIKHQKRIPEGAAVDIELHIGNKRVGLQGKVHRTTGFPGQLRTSILLDLPD